jgi:hypothetical protein
LQNVSAGTISVTIALRSCFWCSASDALEGAAWAASWTKIAGRYWLPVSGPWRLRVVGLWIA